MKLISTIINYCRKQNGKGIHVSFVTHRIFNLYAGDLGVENVEDLSVEGANEDDRYHEVQDEDKHVVLGSRPGFHRRQVLCTDGHVYLQLKRCSTEDESKSPCL